MLKYLVLLLLCSIIQVYALIENYSENDTLSNDILSDLPEEEKNPLVSVYTNLVYTLNYPEDVQINECIKFAKNEIQSPKNEVIQEKNSDKTEQINKPDDTTENNTTHQNKTEKPVYIPSQNEIEFNNMSWEERCNKIYEHLRVFLINHDLLFKVPYYRRNVIRISLKDWITNGTLVDVKFYAEGKIDDFDEDKLPKVELQSLTRLRTQVEQFFKAFWYFGSLALGFFPGLSYIIFFPVWLGFRIFAFFW